MGDERRPLRVLELRLRCARGCVKKVERLIVGLNFQSVADCKNKLEARSQVALPSERSEFASLLACRGLQTCGLAIGRAGKTVDHTITKVRRISRPGRRSCLPSARGAKHTLARMHVNRAPGLNRLTSEASALKQSKLPLQSN